MNRLVRLVRICEKCVWTMQKNDLNFSDMTLLYQDRGNGHVGKFFCYRHKATPCQSQRLRPWKVVVRTLRGVKTNLWSGMGKHVRWKKRRKGNPKNFFEVVCKRLLRLKGGGQ